MDAAGLLATITEAVVTQGEDDAANRAPKLAVVDPSYTTGDPKVTFEGETTKSTKTYPCLASYSPTPGDRVLLLPVGTSYLIVGSISAGVTTVPTGTIQAFAGAAAPAGWLLCNGAAVSRTTYARLFAVISTTYGTGNGSTTFNLPNLVDRAPVGSGSTYTRAATGGAATVTLTSTTLPTHTHTWSSGSAASAGDHGHSSAGDHGHGLSGGTTSDGSHDHSVNNQNTRSDILAGGGTTTAATSSGASTGSAGGHSHSLSGSVSSGGSHSHPNTGSHTHTVTGTIGNAGTGSAHENMPPYLAIPFIIKT